LPIGKQHRLEYKVEKNEEGLLRDFLLKHKHLSRKSVSSIKHAGDLRLNGSHVTVRAFVKSGDIVVEAPIGRARHSIISREVSEDGQYAKTHYEVVNRYEGYTCLEVKLETGRTHQIRVHLSYIGHPLLGDDLYGGQRDRISRQALHAYYTRFQHPQTGEEVSFKAPIPQDLSSLI